MVRTSGINPARRCSSHSSWLYTEYALPTCCLVVPDSKIAKKALNAPKRPRKASDDLNDFTNSNNDAGSPAATPDAAEQSGLDDASAARRAFMDFMNSKDTAASEDDSDFSEDEWAPDDDWHHSAWECPDESAADTYMDNPTTRKSKAVKRKSPEKDPNAPKQPKNAFQEFVRHTHTHRHSHTRTRTHMHTQTR